MKLLDTFQAADQASILEQNEINQPGSPLLLGRLMIRKLRLAPWGLKKILNPIDNLQAIKDQQARISYLSTHQATSDQLQQALAKIAAGKEPLLGYFQEQNSFHDQVKKLYFPEFFQDLNRNRYALDAAFTLDFVKLAAVVGTSFGLHAVMDDLYSSNRDEDVKALNKVRSHVFIFKHLNKMHPIADPQQEQSRYMMPISQVGDLIRKEPFSWMKSIKKGLMMPLNNHILVYKTLTESQDPSKWLSAGVQTCFALAQDMFLAMELKKFSENIRFAWQTPARLAADLRTVADCIGACQDIVAAAQASPQLASWQPIEKLNRLFDQQSSISAKLRKLIELLNEIKHDTNSLVYSRGRILLAHAALQEIKYELIPVLQAIGQVDALCCITRLIKNSTPQKPWCFVDFCDADCSIELDEFWLPLLEGESIVVNSLLLRDDMPKKCIITGPNGGGKSTIMKAIAYQIIFAQSCGIASATCARMSLFHGVRTALNPSEDIKRGLSTFMAQQKRMNELREYCHHQAHENKTVFLAVDEPYRGTVEATSQQFVQEFCTEIAPLSGVMMVLATHFEKPTYLPEKMPNVFANYQCEFIKTDDAQLKPSYRLLPGVASWWFHDDALRSLYLKCLESAYL